MASKASKAKRRNGSRQTGGDVSQSDRGSATFELVLRTSTELFAEKGFHGASMRQLAERGGLVPSGFYYYYKSKYAVLLAIIEESVTIMENEAAQVADDLSPDRRLAGLVEGHVRMHLRESEMLRVYDREIGELKKKDLSRILSRLNDYEQLFRSAIQGGMDDKTFAPGIDVKVATKSILIMATGVMEWWRPRGRLSAEETGELIAQYCLNVVRLPTSL